MQERDGTIPQGAGLVWTVALPGLVGLLSVTALASQNADRGIRVWDLLVPMFLATAVALGACVAARLLVRGVGRRSLLGAWMTAGVLVGGRVAESIPGIPHGSWMEPVFGVLLLVGPTAILRRSTWVPRAGAVRILGISFIILLGFQLLEMRGLLWERTDRVIPVVESGPQGSDDPDIYFILLDAYSGPGSLREFYDLDISPFIENLEALGFEVARRSHANYTPTYLAVAAMLDWDYPDDVLRLKSPADRSRNELYARLHDNRTIRFLKERGYEVIFYRSSYPPLRSSPAADRHVPVTVAGQFEQRWFSQTLFPGWFRAACSLMTCRDSARPVFAADAAPAYEAKFRALRESSVPAMLPRFHYVHLLLPHEPFLFRRHCRPRSVAYWPSEVSASNEGMIKEMYREQVQCLNTLLWELVQEIIGQNENRIIILQADHGYARFPDGRPPAFERATREQVRERMDAFGAYYVSGRATDLAYDGITPVNAMRAVFRHVFALDLPPVPDRSYWSSFERPYDLRRLTAEDLRGAVAHDAEAEVAPVLNRPP